MLQEDARFVIEKRGYRSLQLSVKGLLLTLATLGVVVRVRMRCVCIRVRVCGAGLARV